MRHRTGLAALALAVLLAPAAEAQAPKPNTACFNPKETEAESEVRAGIGLREILRRCAMEYPDGQQALADWYAFDAKNADRLKGAVALRSNALKRIYPKRTQMEQWENDASVASRAAPEINEGVCKATYDVVARIKKEDWKGFKYYANLQKQLLVTEIPICPATPAGG